MPGLGQSSACVGWDGLKYTQRWFAARTAQGRRDGALGSAVGSGAARYRGVHIRMPYQQAEEPDSTDSLEFLLVCCAFPAPCRDGEGPRGKKKIHVHMCVCRASSTLYDVGIFRSFKCHLRSAGFRQHVEGRESSSEDLLKTLRRCSVGKLFATRVSVALRDSVRGGMGWGWTRGSERSISTLMIP